MRIAFHSSNIDIRGTCVAMYDYAFYNEKILGNTSIIVAPLKCIEMSDKNALNKFRHTFRLFLYENEIDLETILIDCDVFYIIKYGKNDNFISKTIKTVVHCVFDMSEPHGHVYAGVSKTLAKKFNQSLFVPHIVKKTKEGESMREKLGMPRHALVFGRYGGMDTFDLFFAMRVITQIVTHYTHIYFLFINTPDFYQHKQIIHLPTIVTDEEKANFIATCDAHLECGTLGHTFGLAMAEFSIKNKPIIAYNGEIWNRAHIDILGDKGIYYSTEEEFYTILTTFDPLYYISRDMNCYREFEPEIVMQKFKQVFLS